jgi:hypothetical protein
VGRVKAKRSESEETGDRKPVARGRNDSLLNGRKLWRDYGYLIDNRTDQ